MSLRRIKFRHVQCFVEIARRGSFKDAARALSLTQPAISKTLKELETIVAARLLERNRGGVALTRAGKVFLQFAEISVAALQQGVDGVAGGARTRLTIGALPSVAARLLPEAARRFADLAPEAVLEVQDGPHAYLVERLKDGRLDLVVGRLGAPETMQGLSFTQVYTETVVFAVRPGHPVLAKPELPALAAYPILYPPEGSAIRPLVDRLMISAGMGALPNRIETVSGAFGRTYARNSDAIWIISAGVVTDDLREGLLIALPIDTSLTAGPVGVMTRALSEATPVERLFRLALQSAADDLAI